MYPDIMAEGGLLHFFFLLDEWSILPSLIFMGVGAMTDFGPLIANPKSFLLGAAAQFGIFAAYFGAIWLGFNDKAAAAISIIGGADGPTSIFLAMKLGQRTVPCPGWTDVVIGPYMGGVIGRTSNARPYGINDGAVRREQAPALRLRSMARRPVLTQTTENACHCEAVGRGNPFLRHLKNAIARRVTER